MAVKEKERKRAQKRSGKKESTERDCVLSRRFDRVPVGFGFLQRLISDDTVKNNNNINNNQKKKKEFVKLLVTLRDVWRPRALAMLKSDPGIVTEKITRCVADVPVR